MLNYPAKSPNLLACRQAVRGIEGPVIIGVSGGADSLALAAACVAEKIDARAVIIDHGLQENSAEITSWAHQVVKDLGLEAEVIKVEVTGSSMEAAARDARYQALRQHAQGKDILVAHTRDDQAETLLLSLLRGHTGVMHVRNGDIVRPFLNISRAQTEGACREVGLQWWDDPHNEDEAFRRVAIRRQVLPLFDDLLGGDSRLPLAQAAADLADDEAFFRDHLTYTDSCVELAKNPPALRRRRIAHFLHFHGFAITRPTIDAISSLCTDWKGQGGVAVGFDAGSRVIVVREEERLRIKKE